MMDDYRISEKLPKNAKNMVTDPTAPAILLGFAGSDPQFSGWLNFFKVLRIDDGRNQRGVKEDVFFDG
jgi:hypothetical protein